MNLQNSMKRQNWDKFRRMQVNIDKAVENKEVSNLLKKHYTALRRQLIKSAEDEDIFIDAFLKITYKYKEQLDFIEQFTHLFLQLKREYRRDDKALNCIKIIENRISIPDISNIEKPPKNTLLITKLKALCLS